MAAHVNLNKYLSVIPTRFFPPKNISREPLTYRPHLNMANSTKVVEVISEYADRKHSYATARPIETLSREDATQIAQAVARAIP